MGHAKTKECVRGYFYLENILLQGAGQEGDRVFLAPSPWEQQRTAAPGLFLPQQPSQTLPHPWAPWSPRRGFRGAPSSVPTHSVTGAGLCPSLGLPLALSFS